LSYFNELAGGPERGHEHLLGSNLDWGQDLLYVESALRDEPPSESVRILYYGDYLPTEAGFPWPVATELSSRPDAPQPPDGGHFYAVSRAFVHGGRERVPGPDGKSLQPSVDLTQLLDRLHYVQTCGSSIYLYAANDPGLSSPPTAPSVP
jgi:hypothetical protein